MSWENIKLVASIIFVGALVIFGFNHISDVENNDLSKYKGYKIERIFIGRYSANIILVGPGNDTIEKDFKDEQVQSALKGVIIN